MKDREDRHLFCPYQPLSALGLSVSSVHKTWHLQRHAIDTPLMKQIPGLQVAVSTQLISCSSVASANSSAGPRCTRYTAQQRQLQVWRLSLGAIESPSSFTAGGPGQR